MTERTQKIKSILPEIISDKTLTLEEEHFQNETLRPILKFQNELILEVFQQFLVDTKVDFVNLSLNLKKAKISNSIKQNTQIKNLYLGMIIGFFSLNEYSFYTQNKKEINKRIVSLLIERISSQLEKLK